MRRTRRRRKYTWLPVIGTTAGSQLASQWQFAVDADPLGGMATGVRVITFDENQESTGGANALAGNTPLMDILGQEYFLKRIVGKVFVNTRWTTNTVTTIGVNALPALIVTAGLFIARADGTFPTLPLDFATESGLYNPANATVTREPWIWRRQWILGMVDGVGLGLSASATVTHNIYGAQTAYPPSNALYGSMSDGPHVDARTARRVNQEERLFFACNVQPHQAFASDLAPLGIDVFSEFRLLGQIRKPRNRGSF